jgi:hypothetical protein
MSCPAQHVATAGASVAAVRRPGPGHLSIARDDGIGIKARATTLGRAPTRHRPPLSVSCLVTGRQRAFRRRACGRDAETASAPHTLTRQVWTPDSLTLCWMDCAGHVHGRPLALFPQLPAGASGKRLDFVCMVSRYFWNLKIIRTILSGHRKILEFSSLLKNESRGF